MHIHRLTVQDALASLGSSEDGLAWEEASRRLAEFGENRLEAPAGEPLWLRFIKEFTHLFSLILWIAAALSLIAQWSAPGQGMGKLALAIVAVILISGAFSFWQEYRAERTLAALSGLLPNQSVVMREGKPAQIPLASLVVGDVVLLQEGDHVPADCRLTEGFGVKVSNATVTGEAVPLYREAGPSSVEEWTRARNILLAGTSVVSGQARAVVFATGMRTEFGKIAHLAQSEERGSSPLRREITHISRMIGMIAVVIGTVFFLGGQVIGIPFWKDFVFAIGIIVAMVPEGLLPTLTLALVLATQRMAGKKVLIRHLTSVEALGSTTVICTDKTGTLTQNRMAVKEVFVEGKFSKPSTDLPAPFLKVARFCNDLREGQVSFGDPMEIALASMARDKLLPGSERLFEIPFDDERMRLSTVHDDPEGPQLFCKGAPETVVPLCTRILCEDGEEALRDAHLEKIRSAQEAMAEKGLRVIALAHRSLDENWKAAPLEADMVFAGLAGLEDPPRIEVPQAIEKCRKAGIRVIMVTGDHPATALAIAREIGLIRSENPKVISGDELRGLGETQLRLALDEAEVLFARADAAQKMRIVDALKRKRHVVAVTGDGVNDAPALRCAHIGIAMGLAGTDVAKSAADMVLLDDNFAAIVDAVEEGRAVFDNIGKFLTYILAHNVPELVPYLAFSLFSIPLPLTPIQILSVDMGTDSLTALGLGVEKPDPKAMERPPRPASSRLFDWSLALRAYLFIGLIEAVAAMSCFFFVLKESGWHYGQMLSMHDPVYREATTATLSAIIAMQIVNVFLCRSRRQSVFHTGLSGNPLILVGVAFEIALLFFIDYTPLGNAVFGTSPLAMHIWLLLVPFAAGLLFLEESRKWIVRKIGSIQG
jgi:calcium-translocating P-type ATPase